MQTSIKAEVLALDIRNGLKEAIVAENPSAKVHKSIIHKWRAFRRAASLCSRGHPTESHQDQRNLNSPRGTSLSLGGPTEHVKCQNFQMVCLEETASVMLWKHAHEKAHLCFQKQHLTSETKSCDQIRPKRSCLVGGCFAATGPGDHVVAEWTLKSAISPLS